MRIPIGLHLLAAACLARSAGAQMETRHDTLHVLRVPDPAVVLVELGRADVVLRPGESGVVRVHTRPLPQNRAPSAAFATVRLVDGVVRIAATSKDAANGIGVVIEVPPRANLQIQMERGDVRAAGLHADISVTTARGDVRLQEISGSAIVDVRNGNIEADFRSFSTRLPSAFVTLNGNVQVTIPANAAVQLDVRCRGCVLSDVPRILGGRITRLLTPPNGDPVLGLHASIGTDGSVLRIFTWNGDVALRIR